MIRINLIANTAGILSLISSFAFACPIFARVNRKNTIDKKLVYSISYINLSVTICLSLIHGLLTTQIADIDYADIHTYWIYAGGLFAFNLFVFIAIAFSELKRNLKLLDYFSYAILLLLILHVGQKIAF